MTRSYFITATGTDQGKTLITTALCYQLRQMGKSVRVVKPILSGDDGGMQTDTARILQSLGEEVTESARKRITPWSFQMPLSPDEAARREERELHLPEVVAFCQQIPSADYRLIEGAGGVMSPLTGQHTNLDMIKALDIPVILVSASYLGCISHILTALETLKAHCVSCYHLALTQPDSHTQPVEITLASLQSQLPEGMKLAVVNHLASGGEIWKDVPSLTEWIG